MKLNPQSKFSALALIGGSIACATSLSAATLMGSFADYDNTQVDLTASGDLDWAYWESTSNPFPAPGTTNSKLGGTLIANPTVVGTGNLRGSNSNTFVDITFSDGTSPTSGSFAGVSGIFSTSLNTPGAGISIDITLPEAGVTYYITLWGSEYATQTSGDTGGIFTASLPGASDYSSNAFYGPATSPKASAVYSITASADNNNDVLTLTYVLPSQTRANGHVLFDALTVSSVPEPSTYALIIGAAAFVGLVMRRRKMR